MTIGEKIRYIRTSKKLSAEKLAKSAGLGQSTISEIELGKKSPTIVTLEKICSALNITLVELFASDSKSKTENTNPQLKELLSNAKYLTSEQLQKLNEFIKTLK
jgi:transcriptional regulator with XRE-family HTH domain